MFKNQSNFKNVAHCWGVRVAYREQSEPGVCGHGTHGPLTAPSSPGRHRFGVVAVSLGPGAHRAPSAVDGIGILDHMEPGG